MPIPPARGAPAHPGEGLSHVAGRAYPTTREVWHGEEPRSRPRASTGADQPAPTSLPFHKQEPSPGGGRRCPEGPPHLTLRGKGLLPGGKHRGQRLQRVLGVRALHNREEGRESLATEQRTGGRRLRSPAPPGSPAPEAPLAGVQPPSLPHPLRQHLLRMYPNDKDPGPKERRGGGQKISVPTTPVQPLMPGSATVRSPGAVNSRGTTPANRGKMGGGGSKELS